MAYRENAIPVADAAAPQATTGARVFLDMPAAVVAEFREARTDMDRATKERAEQERLCEDLMSQYRRALDRPDPNWAAVGHTHVLHLQARTRLVALDESMEKAARRHKRACDEFMRAAFAAEEAA